MICGLDLGSTLIKACWEKNGHYDFISTISLSLPEFSERLKSKNITEANIAGIALLPPELEFLKIHKPEGDLIDHELKAQAIGLAALSNKLPSEFLLASVGTGTSYTRINYKKMSRLPVGNSLGGGFIMGLGQALGFKDFKDVIKKAQAGDHFKVDKYYKDLIVANMAETTTNTAQKDIAAGLMNIVAITTMKDLMLYTAHPRYGRFKNVIYIGSTVADNPYLQKLLIKYTKEIDKKPIFVKKGEYATCLGALLSDHS
ncbi:hypothetical protein KKC88_02440 [Patescibacteria group bacterium]|nr:hypothetical protein [Patescibacteria group bacterium]MBU1672941.1 hypothetical protein [Patescibacteria group bacterium]MBU1963583.1 hypothetical protein [Patescibacteria group bacterium]MBU1963584.1 hypothetical protein [Patescibacteria group bacterium]